MTVMADNYPMSSFSKEKSFSIDSEDDLKKLSSKATIPADELYGISKPENVVSTTTSARYCSNSQYTHDMFLVYDPDRDYYNAQNLLKEIEPLDLSILDFNRDAPPGIPSTKFFADALKQCKYTCIIVSRQFMDNFWITFKTDMAIENMLEDESKQYTGRLIIVVMDASLKVNELPLDLRTISPICLSERYFKTRLLRAFQGPLFGQSGKSNQKKSLSSVSSSSSSIMPHQPCGSESIPTTCTETSCEPSSSRYQPESFRSSVDYSSSKDSKHEKSSSPSLSPLAPHVCKVAIHNPSPPGAHNLSLQSSVTSFLPAQDLRLSANSSSQSRLQSLSSNCERSCTYQERLNAGCVSEDRSSEFTPSSQQRSFSSFGNNSQTSSSSDLYSASHSNIKKKSFEEMKNSADTTQSAAVPIFHSLTEFSTQSVTMVPEGKKNQPISSAANSDRLMLSRTPQEHTESISLAAQADGVQRMISVTRNSTGMRQPTEGDDSSELGNSFSQTSLSAVQLESVKSCDSNDLEAGGSIPRSSSNNNSTLSPNNSKQNRFLSTSSSNPHNDNPVFSGLIRSVNDEIFVDDSIEHYHVEISDEELPRPLVGSKNISQTDRRTPSPRRSTKGSSVSISDSFDSIGASIKASVKNLFK